MTEWKLAPWEPTQEMIEAGKTAPLIDTGDDAYDQAEDYKRVYQAMWSVIPKPDQGAEIASRDAEIARLKAENEALHEEIKCAYATANRDMARMHKAIEESETLRDQVVLLTENVRLPWSALEYSVKQVPDLATVPGISAALAAVKGEQA